MIVTHKSKPNFNVKAIIDPELIFLRYNYTQTNTVIMKYDISICIVMIYHMRRNKIVIQKHFAELSKFDFHITARETRNRFLRKLLFLNNELFVHQPYNRNSSFVSRNNLVLSRISYRQLGMWQTVIPFCAIRTLYFINTIMYHKSSQA